MTRYDYLIVGGGLAADAAVRAIRERDPHGTIGLLCAEAHSPYRRPPLSKGLWKDEAEETVWTGTEALGVTLHLRTRAAGLEPDLRRVTDVFGQEYLYGRLLLATGGRARTLPGQPEEVIAFRTLDDYRRLRDLATAGRRVVVLGGGFIGSELAAALAGRGARVTLVVPEEGIGARLFPADLSRAVTALYRDHGVEVRTGERAAAIAREGAGLVVETGTGDRIGGDVVVTGLGIEPETDLAARAGLPVADGIVVDARLRTPDRRVFAAGDVANVFSPALGERRRVEHEDAALTMGRAAGLGMTGEEEPYTHLPFFYSDLFDLGYEAVGLVDSRLHSVAEWTEPFREGVVRYERNGRIVGLLLWNVWGKVDAARDVIASGTAGGSDVTERLAAITRGRIPPISPPRT